MALIDNGILSFMFEGVRRGDEEHLKAALNENGEVTLKLVSAESPNLFRAIYHFKLVKKFIPQEATPEDPPADWAVHELPELLVEVDQSKSLDSIGALSNETPELLSEKDVHDALKVKTFATLEEALNDGKSMHLTGTVDDGGEVRFDGVIQVIPTTDDSTDDLLIVEGDELVGETEAVKFPENEEIPVEKVDVAPIVKSPKAKKAK